jgi:MoaA/NifB/PqqE/SkfB family radical SAM enzyme
VTGLDFRLYRPKPGHPDFKACQEQALELAGRIIPIIRKDSDLTASDRLQDARRRSRALLKTAANLAINWKRYRRGDHALRPLYVIWTMLNACNFRCVYCDNHQGEHYFDLPDPDRLDTAGGKRLLEVMITGTPAIYWCGGEPTLRRDLPELLDHAWRLGYFPNMINTNGSILHRRLQDPAWRDFLYKMDIVIMSLDGLDVRRLDSLWGVRAAEQVMVNLLMMRELKKASRFKLAINTVITPGTIDEARAVLDLAADLDVWFVPVPENIKHQPNRKLLEDPGYRELAELILARKRGGQKIIGSARLLRQLLFAEPYTCLTTLKPHIWSNGEMCWPCRAAQNVEPINISLLDYPSFDAAYRAARERINPDFFHGPGERQCGGQCAWMQNYTTARYAQGLADPLGSGIFSELFEFALDPRNW